MLYTPYLTSDLFFFQEISASFSIPFRADMAPQPSVPSFDEIRPKPFKKIPCAWPIRVCEAVGTETSSRSQGLEWEKL